MVRPAWRRASARASPMLTPRLHCHIGLRAARGAGAVAGWEPPCNAGSLTSVDIPPKRTAGRRRSRSVLPAPERINHTIGVLGPDQDVPGLGTFARPDDAPALQQVHEPACFRETHPQFALQHR